MKSGFSNKIFSLVVLVAALGYFVDIYDLLLFSIVRVKSLESLGLSNELIDSEGKFIISVQMYGLLIGGIFWGVMGDKKGRLSVLFGSIILYSIANIANGFVQNISQYAIARFVAGIGLAGELGAGITLVSELVLKEKRGVATSMVAGIGLTGAIAAYFISHFFDWRVCYFIGGGLGLCLLLLRMGVFESGMYKELKTKNAQKGNLLMLFSNWQRFKKFLLAILIGLPIWYIIGILFTFSKEFGEHFSFSKPVDSGKTIMFAYITYAIGDILIGILSNIIRSRKKALYIFYTITTFGLILYFNQQNGSVQGMYAICMILGLGAGFWALFVTMAAEHFGTNLRATVTTIAPNMVRGSLPLIIVLFNSLKPSNGYIQAGAITGVIVMVISIIAVLLTEETFGKDLDFIEE